MTSDPLRVVYGRNSDTRLKHSDINPLSLSATRQSCCVRARLQLSFSSFISRALAVEVSRRVEAVSRLMSRGVEAMSRLVSRLVSRLCRGDTMRVRCRGVEADVEGMYVEARRLMSVRMFHFPCPPFLLVP